MVKFEGVKTSKKLGKLGGDTGVGVAVKINAEVVSAEYVKDDKGKAKLSSGGNKQVALNCKTEKDFKKTDGAIVKIATYFNANYFESDYSPKLKDVKPSDKLKKFVEVNYNTGGVDKNGGLPFGNFKVRNYEGQDGFPKTAISIFGGNIQQAIKKDGIYTIKDFEGKDSVFTVSENIRVSLKGFIEPIVNTEKFITNNYDEESKTLKFNMYYLQNDNEYNLIMPMMLENIEREKVFKFIDFVKKAENTIIGVKGSVKKSPIYREPEEDESSEFGEYNYGGLTAVGWEASIVIDFDAEKDNWIIAKTKNTGSIIISSEEVPIAEVKEEDVF